MKKVWLCLLSGVIAMAGIVGWRANSADARPPYFNEFKAKYLHADSTDPADQAWAKQITDVTKCGVCHMGDSKKMRNAYGQALSKLLTKDDVKDQKKIQDALDTVAKQPSAPDSKTTFGDLIKDHKLPGGG